MKKIYHLSTCSTCKRIIKELDLNSNGFEMQDIKSNPITESQLDKMREMSGSYESLFSRRSMKFRPMGLHEMELSESDYRKYILEEYSFLKRPVIIVKDEIFIGNSKKVIAEVATKLD
ncbi:arsenate reductase family protein [Reichenbachiella versicolor]|uniref:arsenate reductase family protein n=1 Tax=Reichenbachiella versicolor TaxID=1821036 RepID=UPI000D6E2992|nr:ArsC/Spx/MgsR family protein [Reichenbachiella versicolor]